MGQQVPRVDPAQNLNYFFQDPARFDNLLCLQPKSLFDDNKENLIRNTVVDNNMHEELQVDL